MAKWVAVLVGVVLVATNAFWLYSAVDWAATQKYRKQEAYEATHRIEALQRLCNKLVAGMTKAEASELLHALSPDSQPFEKDGYINTLWISFKLDQHGKVADVGACK